MMAYKAKYLPPLKLSLDLDYTKDELLNLKEQQVFWALVRLCEEGEGYYFQRTRYPSPNNDIPVSKVSLNMIKTLSKKEVINVATIKVTPWGAHDPVDNGTMIRVSISDIGLSWIKGERFNA